ncbi:hypothetical protein YIM1640_14600 [Thermus oshimai]|jgi:carbonic anhydrase|uniref:Carbonic anhydrase n=1 Tax=Thermus oshimai JL-2 TaxID=751945 RepID=K7QZ43_THEOS|nr:carbonic anhydrase [Thermus oshimai]AFV76085.1 carbonic anhydrase [Thermus oshimai JL-2]
MDPIALLLESHNEGRSFPPLAKPELLLVTCMDHRIALRLPENFAFVLRTGGANPDPVEPYLVYALARTGVRTVALVGHTDCAMSRPDLEALRTLPQGLEALYRPRIAGLAVGDPAAFVVRKARELEARLGVRAVPLLYRVEDHRLLRLEGEAALDPGHGLAACG